MLELSSLREDQARFRQGLDLLRDDLEALKHDTRTKADEMHEKQEQKKRSDLKSATV